MIQPIANALLPGALGQAAPTLDRLVPQQQPAAQVAPVQGTSSDQSQQAGLGSSSPGMPKSLEPPKSSLEKALDAVNDSLKAWSTGMRFDMDKDAQRMVISIVDSSTGKVLQTIPSDAVLRVAKMIIQLQGAGVNTQA